MRNLSLTFSKTRVLLNNLSFDVPSSSSLGIIGPSGSGKTLLAKVIMNLLTKEFSVSGNVLFKNTSLLDSHNAKKFLGSELSMIFQNPNSSLSPKMTIGTQITEAIFCHFPNIKKRTALDLAVTLLEKVKLSQPHKYLKKYPFELSGGEQQKVLIAIAISGNPSLIIADEPTTSLDPISTLHVLSLLQELKKSHKFSLILISHNFSMIPSLCDHLLIMNHGTIIEKGLVNQITLYPQHEMTKLLFKTFSSFSMPLLQTQSV